MRYARYPQYNESFFGKTAVGEIAWKHRDQHPTVFVQYKYSGFRDEDPLIEASFSPAQREQNGLNIQSDVRRFFNSIDGFASIFSVRVEYDNPDSDERSVEIYFDTDFGRHSGKGTQDDERR